MKANQVRIGDGDLPDPYDIELLKAIGPIRSDINAVIPLPDSMTVDGPVAASRPKHKLSGNENKSDLKLITLLLAKGFAEK
ncbi:hypothetical protein ACSQ67_018224 [Phaseolus vulgaris]